MAQETVVVDKAAWDAAQLAVARVGDVLKAQQNQRGEALIDAAIQAGKFAPARREHWVKLFGADPQGTEQVLATLAPGAIPLAAVGTSLPGPGSEFGAAAGGGDQAYPAGWLSPAEAATKQRVAAGDTSPPIVTRVND